MAQQIFEVSINFIETFIIVLFYTKYLGSKYSDIRKYIFFIIAWLFCFIEVCIINSFTVFESFGAYIPIVIYFIYGLLCLNGNVLLKLWIAAIAHIIVVMVAVISNTGICWLIGYDPNKMITTFNSVRIIGVTISKAILFLSYYIILKFRYKNPIKNHLWYKLIIIPLFSVISISLLMKVVLVHRDMLGYILIGMLCIVTANILTYYFYTVINQEYDDKLKMKLLEQQNENAQVNIKNSASFVNQMRIVKHDIKNQLYTIYNYIDSDEIDKAKNYIIELTDDYLPTVKNLITTDNLAFDAIVNSKLTLCEQKKIYFETKLMQGCLKNFNHVDTSILFGNLLDNAIEAAEKTDNKRITLEIKQKGDYLSIVICNSINESVLENNKDLATTKRDKEFHGIGIKSIKSIVEKYNGMIQYYEEDNEFYCDILLYIKQ